MSVSYFCPICVIISELSMLCSVACIKSANQVIAVMSVLYNHFVAIECEEFADMHQFGF